MAVYTFAIVFARFSLYGLWKTCPVVQGVFLPAKGSDWAHPGMSSGPQLAAEGNS